MKQVYWVALPALLLASCDERIQVNPPTDPAPSVEAPDSPSSPAPGSPGASSPLPGTGPASFVGRWAANAS